MISFSGILLQTRVREAVESLNKEGLSVSGVVCHVGKKQDREHLIDEVSMTQHSISMPSVNSCII